MGTLHTRVQTGNNVPISLAKRERTAIFTAPQKRSIGGRKGILNGDVSIFCYCHDLTKILRKRGGFNTVFHCRFLYSYRMKATPNQRSSELRRWLIFSIGGLVLIGAGVSVTGEAIIRKAASEGWFLLGTMGLVILNSGVSCVGQGVIHRIRMDHVSR
jgi:hypothetical protein